MHGNPWGRFSETENNKLFVYKMFFSCCYKYKWTDNKINFSNLKINATHYIYGIRNNEQNGVKQSFTFTASLSKKIERSSVTKYFLKLQYTAVICALINNRLMKLCPSTCFLRLITFPNKNGASFYARQSAQLPWRCIAWRSRSQRCRDNSNKLHRLVLSL